MVIIMEDKEHIAKTTFNNLPQEKQEKVINAAVAEFARNGYQKASLNIIVRDAGISKGSLYQYFRNKEELFVFIFSRFTLLVKKAVKIADLGGDSDFFSQVGRVLFAGIEFINRYPDFFQIYLRVLFERDIPMREKLLAEVRLFSREYFGPLCREGQQCGAIRQDIPTDVVIFVLDATLDRFLQSYAQNTLAHDFGLERLDRDYLSYQVNMILQVLKSGLIIQKTGE